MNRPRHGFTVVEVMIVLAISSMMLISASAVFKGRRADTGFSQAVYDLQSEIQSLAGIVSSKAVPGLQQYTCAPGNIGGSMRPVLTSGSTTGQSCIYLGQAIQVKPDSSTLYSYPIFGLRTIYSGLNDTGDYPSTPSQANPEPAVDAAAPSNPNSLLLITDYTLLNGVKVSSAKYAGTENDILTLYSSLQDANTSGNEISVSSMSYSGSATDPKAQIKDCVEGNGCPADGNSVANGAWSLCVTDGTRNAQIDIRGTPTGIDSKITIGNCS